MEKSVIRFATAGEASTLVLSMPAELDDEEKQFFCVPFATGQGGMLLALPENSFERSRLLAGQLAEDDALLALQRL